MSKISGLHHVTAIAGDAQRNVDFYTGTLGMRLVKRSVNQDSPGTYHLFYADAAGSPGTDLTFFPWPEMAPARPGIGSSMEVSLAVPAGSTEYWRGRLASHDVKAGDESRRGAAALVFRDPHGLPVALVETTDARESVPWNESPVPQDSQILGLHAVRLWERELARTTDFLRDVLGFRDAGRDGEWSGWEVGAGGSGCLVELREVPTERRGEWGTGGIHHVAWRVADEAAELEVRARIAAAHRRPTEVIDRFWFKSVYFLEPGGVLFELATDGPGFAVDEDPGLLGEKLVLPPWLEAQRSQIESSLPVLRMAAKGTGM